MIDRLRGAGVGRLLGGVALAALLVAVVRSVPDWVELWGAPCRSLVLVSFVAMTLGERLRAELPGRRSIAPLATAAALGFAMAYPREATTPASGRGWSYGWSVVVVVTALAMLLGALPELVQRKLAPSDLAPRLLSIAVIAFAYRQLPLWDGASTLDLALHGTLKGAGAAFLMVAVAVLALGVEGVLTSLSEAARQHGQFRRTLVDTGRALWGIAVALSATASLIVLAYVEIGLPAIPLLLLPLALTHFGVRRFASIRATYRQTIVALSRLTETSGYLARGHSERVAELSVSMGRALGMSDKDVTELEYAALLHDIGQLGLVDPIPRGATVMAAPADQHRIATDGAHIVRETGVLDGVAGILERQATPYRLTREFGQNLPLASRIIKVSNAFDDLAEGEQDSRSRYAALERIHLGLGYEYDPAVVEALSRVLERQPG